MSVVKISQTSMDSTIHAGHGTVGTTESSLSGIPFFSWRGILVRAESTNTDSIYVGQAGYAPSGFTLGPGEQVEIPVDHSSAIGIVAASGTQSFSYLSV